MLDYSVDQSADVKAPRVGQIIAIAVDATSRGYDLTALKSWNEVSNLKAGTRNHFFVSVQAETNDVYYALDQAAVATNTIDDTSVIAAGAAIVLPTISSVGAAPDNIRTYSAAVPPAHLVAGLPPIDIRIDHLVDKTLILKCASGKTATFRIWPSSKNEPGADR